MSGITRNHEHERLHHLHAVLAGVGQQLHLGGFVQTHAIFQLGLFDLLKRVSLCVEVTLGHGGGLFDEAVFHRSCQWVVHHHVLERYGAARGFHERCCRYFQAEQRLQLIDGANPCAGAIAMRLIHQQHEIWQTGQMVEVAVPKHFLHPLDAWLFAATHLGVDLGDVEDVDSNLAEQFSSQNVLLVIVVARDYPRRADCQLTNALEHILCGIGGEIRDQLVIDRQVRSQHEEVVDAVR